MKKENRITGLVALTVVTVLAFVIIFATRGLESKEKEADNATKVEYKYEDMDVADTKGIQAAAKLLDEKGEQVGYMVTFAQAGFGGDIVAEVYFENDKETMKSLVIKEHKETEGYGSKMEEPKFKDQFIGIKAPVVIDGMQLDNSDATGTNVDAISGATISTEAVLVGINNAYNFLNGVESSDDEVATTTETQEVKPVIVYELEEIDVAEAKGIQSAAKLSLEGEFVGYMVTVSQAGYGGDVVTEVYFETDAITLIAVEIKEHTETNKLGSRITEPEFKDQFIGISAPVVIEGMTLDNAEETGTKVDAVTAATISTEAVIVGVNNAYNFLKGVVSAN